MVLHKQPKKLNFHLLAAGDRRVSSRDGVGVKRGSEIQAERSELSNVLYILLNFSRSQLPHHSAVVRARAPTGKVTGSIPGLTH